MPLLEGDKKVNEVLTIKPYKLLTRLPVLLTHIKVRNN